MTEQVPTYGSSDEAILSYPTVYREDLLADQVALVSGAGSGLGKVTAALLGRLGAEVIICGRTREKLDSVVVFLEGAGIRARAHAMTIRDPEGVDALMDEIWSRYEKLDILVNNAGGQFPQAALDFTIKGWNAVIDTNLNGTWYMTQAAARRWHARGQAGNVVNIVADVWRGLPQMAHTAAARAGVIYLTRTVAVEWAPYGIRVNCVAPGCCESSAFARYPAAGASSFEQSNPMMRSGDEFDIAESVVYLAAPSGKFITGEVITVDGGQQLWGDPWPAGRPVEFEIDYRRPE